MGKGENPARFLGRVVLSRDKKRKGRACSYRRCQLEGCDGYQIEVKWGKGKRTWPCTKALKELENGQLQIV